MSRKPKRKAETIIKKGRRRYGGIYRLEDGRRAYLAYRNLRDIFRSGKTTISDAVRDGTACWAIDEEHINMLRVQGVEFIGVLVRDTKDIYLSRAATWLDRTKIKFHNYSHNGGSLQRLLPLSHFVARRRRSKI